MNPKLTSQDVLQIKAYIKFAGDKKQRAYADFLTTLKVLEANLSPEALHWISNVSSATLDKELSMWHEEYRIERTKQGYRARRFIKNRGEYAKAITAAGLDSQQIKRFQTFFRR